jgi:hypothetical protein
MPAQARPPSHIENCSAFSTSYCSQKWCSRLAQLSNTGLQIRRELIYSFHKQWSYQISCQRVLASITILYHYRVQTRVQTCVQTKSRQRASLVIPIFPPAINCHAKPNKVGLHCVIQCTTCMRKPRFCSRHFLLRFSESTHHFL